MDNGKRKTRQIKIGNVLVGGGAPVAVQSMTSTATRDVRATVKQIRTLTAAGCEIIRVAVKDAFDAQAIAKIKRGITIPIVADIHFDHRLALMAIKNGADKIRINPGNMRNESGLNEVIDAAYRARIPIRVGINSGSIRRLDEKKGGVGLFIKRARASIKLFEARGFRDIIISAKSSSVIETVMAYRELSRIFDYPLHLGVTAAGSFEMGSVKSSIGIGALLLDGIGDTIRVSLTGNPVREIIQGRRILQALRIRKFGPDIISCPTCGRCQVDLAKIVDEVERAVSSRKWEGKKKALSIAVMGCEVNGPGEARECDIGVAFGRGQGMLFSKGRTVKKIKSGETVKELLKMIGKVG